MAQLHELKTALLDFSIKLEKLSHTIMQSALDIADELHEINKQYLDTIDKL